jgi:hypothetical protein
VFRDPSRIARRLAPCDIADGAELPDPITLAQGGRGRLHRRGPGRWVSSGRAVAFAASESTPECAEQQDQATPRSE